MWVLVGRLWGSQVFACSEEPTILRGRPQLTNTTGVGGGGGGVAGLQAVTREDQKLWWDWKNA